MIGNLVWKTRAGLALVAIAGLSSSSFCQGAPETKPAMAAPLAASTAQAAVQEVNDKNFKKEVLEAETPTLVDFYATWCKPCLRVAPMVDELATEYNGKVKFFRVDVDKSPATASMYEVETMPLLRMFVPGGKNLPALDVVKSKEQIKEYIDGNLK